jgi:hypothetical protein
MSWLRDRKFSVNVIESKAVFSVAAGRYLDGQTISGFSDIAGCDMHGLGVFIELKAKGKRATVRPAQRVFLLDKIEHGAFAVVVDSAACLSHIYRKWKTGIDRKGILKKHLPKQKQTKDKELF